jgi:hypothetical protein
MPKLRQPEVGLIDKWHVTQKIDGMNIRIKLDDPPPDTGGYGELHTIMGRTDKAQLPGDLVSHINELLPDSYRELVYPMCDVWLYGEGYGAGIQKGGHYRDDKGFILFDILVASPEEQNAWWLPWHEVRNIAQLLNLGTVPVLGEDVPLESLTSYALGGTYILDGEKPLGDRDLFEGIVATTQPALYTHRGDRIKVKVKRKDIAKSIEKHTLSEIKRAL